MLSAELSDPGQRNSSCKLAIAAFSQCAFAQRYDSLCARWFCAFVHVLWPSSERQFHPHRRRDGDGFCHLHTTPGLYIPGVSKNAGLYDINRKNQIRTLASTLQFSKVPAITGAFCKQGTEKNDTPLTYGSICEETKGIRV